MGCTITTIIVTRHTGSSRKTHLAKLIGSLSDGSDPMTPSAVWYAPGLSGCENQFRGALGMTVYKYPDWK